jgi:hypothetical protein
MWRGICGKKRRFKRSEVETDFETRKAKFVATSARSRRCGAASGCECVDGVRRGCFAAARAGERAGARCLLRGVPRGAESFRQRRRAVCSGFSRGSPETDGLAHRCPIAGIRCDDCGSEHVGSAESGEQPAAEPYGSKERRGDGQSAGSYDDCFAAGRGGGLSAEGATP